MPTLDPELPRDPECPTCHGEQSHTPEQRAACAGAAALAANRMRGKTTDRETAQPALDFPHDHWSQK